MAPNPPLDPRPEPSPHPAVSLLVGFGVIILGATLVHLVFNGLV